jgi:hypothetical protein
MLDLPLLNNGTAQQVKGAGRQVRIAKAITNFDGGGCRDERRLIVPLADMEFSDGKQQITLFHAVAPFDQALRPSQPAISLPSFASKQKRKTQPKSAAGGARLVTLLHISVISSIQESLKVEVAAD